MDRMEKAIKNIADKLEKPVAKDSTIGASVRPGGNYASVLAKAYVPEIHERRMRITLKDPSEEIKNRSPEDTVRALNKILGVTDGVRAVNVMRNGEVELTFRDLEMKSKAESHKDWVQKVFGTGTEGRAITVTVMARGVAIKGHAEESV